MAREQRAESLDSVVTDDSEDPLTCPLTQRLFHDPVILVASGVTYEASALEECLRRAPDMDPKTGERFELPAVTAPNLVARSLAARRRKRATKKPTSMEPGYRGLPTGPHHDRYKTRICKYACRDDVTAAVATLEDVDRRQTRIFGASHPQTLYTRGRLEQAREKLAHLE